MPTEYVEVLPDAIGRVLNDYPGLAGSHRLAFDGERLGQLWGAQRSSRHPGVKNDSSMILSVPSCSWGLVGFSSALLDPRHSVRNTEEVVQRMLNLFSSIMGVHRTVACPALDLAGECSH